MKLPVEVCLHVLAFLDRQTLGRSMMANGRMSGIVSRHRKTLYLPDVSQE